MKITLQQWCKSVVYTHTPTPTPTHTQWLKPQLMAVILASFVFTLLVSAENECSFDAKLVSLSIPGHYTDPALGYRILCDYDIEVWPNPVGGFSPVEIEIQSDSGTGKTLEIRHVDLAKNTTTVLWSPGTLAGGQTVQLTVSTSGWSTGNHAIQFFLDGELYTRVISKF